MRRQLAPPFVVAPPNGARVRTRLRLSEDDACVLRTVGGHLSSLAGADLKQRCGEGRLDAQLRAGSRRERKQSLTAASTSRWAGAITRTSEDAWQLAWRNLKSEARTLHARIRLIEARLGVSTGGRNGRTHSYASRTERFEKQRKLQILKSRLTKVDERVAAERVSVCRGGRRRAVTGHNLDAASMTQTQWRLRWEASRLFVTADGEAKKRLGNETIRFCPEEGWLELRLPTPLAHLANRPNARYGLSCPVSFSYRRDEVAAQATTGAIRYDISFDPEKGRWYLDASSKTPVRPPPSLEEIAEGSVLGVDLNAGHLAAMVLDRCGNPVGPPRTLGLELDGLPASTRDARVRGTISELLVIAKANDCGAIVIEDLDFKDAREQGRERTENRPGRARRGRAFRRLVARIPTARFRDRLAQMTVNKGLCVVAVDPAYTSKWGAEHWLSPIKRISADATGHHGAAVVIARRGLRQRARRRERCASTPAEHGQKRATDSAVWAVPADAGLSEQRQREPETHKARGQPHRRQKTQRARRPSPGDQVPQDRSEAPTGQDSLLLSV